MKTVMVADFDATKGYFNRTYFYHGITREQAIIAFIEQTMKGNYDTWTYPDKIEGIHKSKMVKDRILYDYTEDIIISAQYA